MGGCNMESRTVGLSFVVFVILFATIKIVVIEKVSIIQDFVPYIDIAKKRETENNKSSVDQVKKSETNEEYVNNFVPNSSRFVDILDTKLSDILSDAKKLGTTFAKAAI